MVITKNYKLITYISIFLLSLISFVNSSFSKDDETVIIINNSTSMSEKLGGGTKIGLVKQGLNNAISKFEGRFKAAIIQSTGGNNNNCKPSIVSRLTNINQTKMVNLTGKISSGGHRSILMALDQASRLFSDNAKNKSIILISDGIDQCGGNPCLWAKNYRNLGISTRIHVIGVNVSSTEKAGLSCIAGYTRGNYKNVKGSNSILSALYGVLNAASIEGHLKAEPEPNFIQRSVSKTNTKVTTNFNKNKNAAAPEITQITLPVKKEFIENNSFVGNNEAVIRTNTDENKVTKRFNFNKKNNVNTYVQPQYYNEVELTGFSALPVKKPNNIPHMQVATNTLPVKRAVPSDIANKVVNNNDDNKQPADKMQVSKDVKNNNANSTPKLNNRLSSSDDNNNNQAKNVARLASKTNAKADTAKKNTGNNNQLNQVQPSLSSKEDKKAIPANNNNKIAKASEGKLSKGTVDLYAQIIKSTPPLKRNVKWKIKKIGGQPNNLITSDNGRNLELDPGVYEAEATLGKATAKTSFQVSANERSVGTVILNAGGIMFNASLAGKSEIVPSLVNIKLARKVDNNVQTNFILNSKTLPNRIVYINPGIYDVFGSIGEDNDIKSSVTVLPGKGITATLNFKESLKFASKTANVNAKIIKDGKELTGNTNVNWQLSNSLGTVHTSKKTNFSLYLKAGKYKLTAKLSSGQILSKLFEIANGQTKNLNLTTN